MFAIGHFALGYIFGKASSKLLRTNLNLPIILVLSVLPDVDLILQLINPTFFNHRGPMHSIVTFTIIMIPFFIKYRKQAVPYYVVLLSHSLIGDFFAGGTELLWPITQDWFGNLAIEVGSLADVIVENILFILGVIFMFKTNDLHSLLKPKNSNLFLIISFGAVFGPVLQMKYGFDMSLPLLLLIPSFFWIILLAYSFLIELWVKVKPKKSLSY